MTINPILTFIQIIRSQVLVRESAEQTDGQLLDRFVRGQDRLAMEALVYRHAPMVWGVCRRTLTHDDAQATFLVLLRKAASIRSREMSSAVVRFFRRKWGTLRNEVWRSMESAWPEVLRCLLQLPAALKVVAYLKGLNLVILRAQVPPGLQADLSVATYQRLAT